MNALQTISSHYYRRLMTAAAVPYTLLTSITVTTSRVSVRVF